MFPKWLTYSGTGDGTTSSNWDLTKRVDHRGLKWTGYFFASSHRRISLITGRPRGCMVLSSPNRLATFVCQSGFPKGLWRFTDSRIEASWLTDNGSATTSFRNRVNALFPSLSAKPADTTESRRSLARSFQAMDFNFRVGFFDPPMISGKGRKCLASERYRMMLTAPCSLSASMSRTAFLWSIFSCPSTCFSLCSYQPT
jgi:hypothetical protein